MKRLECTVQDYAWGDPDSIPRLLGTEPDGTPAAELWMGAHPKAPSRSDSASLDELIADAPAELLGAETADRFGQLPFLFKVLAAAQPLSIQTHPSLDQARAGFARENAAGIDLGAPYRTYRDANHKPELICALTPFAARVGFRPVSEAREVLAILQETAAGPTPHLDELLAQMQADGDDTQVLQGVLAHLLRLDAATVPQLIGEVLDAARQVTSGDRADELAWLDTMDRHFPLDVGIAVALLLNHVDLSPGEAVFLPAGNLHAYLRGTGVELMANSDNVVRGGLTPKHIDIDELLAVVDATPLDPEVQRPGGAVHTYASPVPEFALTKLLGSAEQQEPIALDGTGPRIVLITAGTWILTSDTHEEPLTATQGQVVFVGNDEGALRLLPDAAGTPEAAEAFVAGIGAGE